MMGYYVQLGGTAGKAGGTIMALAPATGPAAPFVAAGGAIVSLFSSFFGQKCPECKRDTDKIVALNKELCVIDARADFTLTGSVGEMKMCGAVPYNIPRSQGEVKIAPEEARQLIAWVQQINQEVVGSYERVESASNYTHTTWVPRLLGKLEQIAAQPSGPLTQLLPSGATLTDLLPWAVGGLLVWRLFS